ncbi:PilZ domain-containing protein [Novosphingobium album (ex Hu et al. 2023)]|uniref:PilZ domain-containing protein n=1 Tax=Novosphingobium album (ex Hu et al. 2023) TaxID=2930093 RepID=A0ABT0B3J1_9SPHN|nr:PilZ domain-containing protein [Novosphingobium album (ex Hu et al. 2023)]MCJ2179490.1 PilZ domain-containing protein [Novosphingobium album (ex Hu et al. 2023)]
MVQEERRRELRTSTVLEARLRWRGAEQETTVLDVSSCGIQAAMPEPPARGTVVELLAGSHALVCQVRWQVGDRFGASFKEPISVSALLESQQGPVTLSELAAPRGFLAGLTRRATAAGRGLQLTAFAIVAGATAWTISTYAKNSPAPVEAARTAMAGSISVPH